MYINGSSVPFRREGRPVSPVILLYCNHNNILTNAAGIAYQQLYVCSAISGSQAMLN